MFSFFPIDVRGVVIWICVVSVVRVRVEVSSQGGLVEKGEDV